MKTLFIRNLPFTTTEADLRKAFEPFGKVHRCSIAKNRDTGESRGFGFVDMEDDPASKAIADMNGRAFGNRSIIVQESDPKTRAGGGAPGPSSGGPSAPRSGPGGPPSGGAGRPMGAGPRPDGPRFAGPRPPMGGGAPAGAGGSSGPSGGAPRPAGGDSGAARPGGPPRPGAPRGFGANATPASERHKQYHERPKDRLKPYKRGHFDFRAELSPEEEEENRRKGLDDGGGDE